MAMYVKSSLLRRAVIASLVLIGITITLIARRNHTARRSSDIFVSELGQQIQINLPKLPDQRNRFRIWPPDLRYAMCKPKIFVYPIPDHIQITEDNKKLCKHSAYNSELILFNELTDPQSSVHKLYHTSNPEEAEIFYIPFFGSCYLYNCWVEHGWKDLSLRCDVDKKYVEPLMDHIESFIDPKTGQSYWARKGGRDHFMSQPMDHSDTYYASRDRLRNATYLTTIGDKRPNMAEQYRRHRDIVIPSATAILNSANIWPLDYIPATSAPGSRVEEEGNPYKRDILALFRGLGEGTPPEDDYSEGVRSLFFTELRQVPRWDIAARSDYGDYAKKLGRTRYGLAPAGWTLDTTRIWEYLAFGVVPVIMADGIVEPFDDDVDWDSMTVRIRRSEAHRMAEILGRITEQEYQEKRRRVWNVGRRIVLGGDTWHYIVRSLCRINEIIRPEQINIEGYQYREL